MAEHSKNDWNRQLDSFRVKEHRKALVKNHHLVCRLRHFKATLRKHPTVTNVNNVIDFLNNDDSFDMIFYGYHMSGILSKHDVLSDIEWDMNNDLYDKRKTLNSKNRKLVKQSHHHWFFGYDSEFDKHPLHMINAHDCQRILNQAMFMKTEIKASQTAMIILHWIEGFSNDDDTDDLVMTMKPVIAFARSQLKLDNLRHRHDGNDDSLDDLLGWYSAINTDTYHKSHVSSMPVYSKIKDHQTILNWLRHRKLIGHKKYRFPASDDRIDIDINMQSFLKPLALMLAQPLHTKVNFRWNF